MVVSSARQALRELLHSRSVAASALRVCVLVVLAQGALVVVRAPFATRPNDLLVPVDTDDAVRWRNATHVNGKALLTLLADLVQALGGRMEMSEEEARSPDGPAILKRVSDDEYWVVKRTLAPVLPEAAVTGDDPAPSERPGAAPLPLPARYRPDVHKIVLFDQWLRAADLSVWISPLSDSATAVLNTGMEEATVSVCVSYRGRPHLAAIMHKGVLHWGLYGRGNDLHLPVAAPMVPFPERFGVAVGSRAAVPLARRAFFDDADLYGSGSLDRLMMAVLGADVDALLLTEPAPRRALCAGHALLRLYGGKVTDLAGREVEYPTHGGETEGEVLAAIFYHKRLLQQVVDAKAGRNVTREGDKV